MQHARPLPGYLALRYRGWRATRYAENRSWYMHLAEDGQHPRAMVITCCDSRVTPFELFSADPGEFFIHRNIANLVPPLDPSGLHRCTLAAVEYAVGVLHVSHLLVIGHSQCGGVKGCIDMCSGHAPALEDAGSAVGRWLDILRPGYMRTEGTPGEDRQQAMEHQAVLVSLENLMTYPVVAEAVADGRLTLHGVWQDIAGGVLLHYDPDQEAFIPL